MTEIEVEEPIDPEYLKGFNDGYLLAQYRPELAAALAKAKDDSPHMLGIRDAIALYSAELSKQYLPEFEQYDISKEEYEGPEPDEPEPDHEK